MSFFEPIRSIAKAVTNPGLVDESRKDIFRDEFDKIIVDTVRAFDTGTWETGIERDGGHFIIVEQYDNRDKAAKGHAQWVRKLKENRNLELKDIDIFGLDDEWGED